MTVTDLSPRDRALELGNRVRAERTDLRRRLQDRELHVVDVIAAPPTCIRHLRLFDLLERAPGPGRSNRTSQYHHRTGKQWIRGLNMRAALANVNLFCEMDDLTPRARLWLMAELRRVYKLPMTSEDHDALERPPLFNGRAA